MRRVHGGAVPVRALHLVEPGVGERDVTRAEHKDAIAGRRGRVLPPQRRQRAARRRHHDGAHRGARCRPTANSSSSPTRCRSRRGWRPCPSVSLQLLGGRVRGVTQAAVGEQALRVLDTLRVDIAFIGTNAISVRHGLSTPDSEEAAVKRAMVARANYVVVAADSSKVGREDFVSFAPITSVDTLITDAEISAADRAELTDQGRRGHRAEIA